MGKEIQSFKYDSIPWRLTLHFFSISEIRQHLLGLWLIMINQLQVRIRPVPVPEIPPETTQSPPQLLGISLLTQFPVRGRS